MLAIEERVRLSDWPIEIAGVFSNKKKASGLSAASKLGLNTEHFGGPELFQDIEQAIKELEVDLVVLAGFMRLLPESFFQAFSGKIINIHPSLLPDFKGLNAQAQALEANVEEAGCSVHMVVPEMDAGRVLAQARVPVLEDDTVETLSERILEKEHLLYPAVIRGIQLGKIRLGNQLNKEDSENSLSLNELLELL